MHQNLWSVQLDGCNPRASWGSATPKPHCTIQVQTIPIRRESVFTASAHRAVTGGPMCVLDPAVDPDSQAAITRITPGPYPEAGSGNSPEYSASPSGEILITDICQGRGDAPRGSINELRIIQVFPKTTWLAETPRIGVAGEENRAPSSAPFGSKMKMLRAGLEGVKLSDPAWRRLAASIDCNAVSCGSFDLADQAKQLGGQPSAIPEIQ